ncbi:gliding motility-associated peptidyl-prolyl isomerase GldI [Robertkochia flava]|uniref:gliding motility-associated peptidyl-prolyl isomerase GldI n=1 Tax=Robertkochia flava TaxID=3447986 RepID=UPI001CCD5D32|nr:gliding motility-associated peptidyl-prolyl isomerase GldI [Robertkochia marina]
MKNSLFLAAFTALVLISCSTPEARRPVSVKTGSFMKQSIERNKKLLEAEEERILGLIEEDSLHDYTRSANGYWYYLETTDSTKTYQPAEGDIVRITYELSDLNNNIIYSEEEIGPVEFKVDKEALFPGIRTAVKLLHEGESATFLFPSALSYGYHGDDDKIGTNIPLKASVTLLEVIERQSDSLPDNQEPQIK